MSVIRCSERFQERTANEEGGTRAFLVITDNKLDEPLNFVGALQADGDLPTRGDGHPYNTYLKFTGVESAEPFGDGALMWLIRCPYKLPVTQTEAEKAAIERAETPSPVDRRVKITRSFDKVDRPLWKDRNEEAILNSASDPFLEPVVVGRSMSVINISCNLLEDPAWLDDLADKINADTVTVRGRTYEPGTLMFEPGDCSDEVTETDTPYYQVSFRLLVDKRGWKERRYQNGLNEITADGVKRRIRIPYKDEAGDPIPYDDERRQDTADVQLLDDNGRFLEDAEPSTAVEKEFEVYEEAPFSGLPGVT